MRFIRRRWRAHRAYLEAQLGKMAYTVGVQNFDGRDGQVRNLEVEITGATAPQQIVIVGAHYASASGASGASGAPGANDNGSGTALVLELARAFSKSAPQKTLRWQGRRRWRRRETGQMIGRSQPAGAAVIARASTSGS